MWREESCAVGAGTHFSLAHLTPEREPASASTQGLPVALGVWGGLQGRCVWRRRGVLPPPSLRFAPCLFRSIRCAHRRTRVFGRVHLAGAAFPVANCAGAAWHVLTKDAYVFSAQGFGGCVLSGGCCRCRVSEGSGRGCESKRRAARDGRGERGVHDVDSIEG